MSGLKSIRARRAPWLGQTFCHGSAQAASCARNGDNGSFNFHVLSSKYFLAEKFCDAIDGLECLNLPHKGRALCFQPLTDIVCFSAQ